MGREDVMTLWAAMLAQCGVKSFCPGPHQARVKGKEETGEAVGVNQGQTVLALHLSRPSPESTPCSMALL